MKNSGNSLLSVVIPVHNGERYIYKTVKNILKQTYRNIEIILVENNSKDHSWEAVCALQSLDTRVKAVQSNVPGTSLARRKGVEEASGRYVVFSDQDDRFYSQNSLSDMVEAIELDGSQICQFNFYVKYRFGLRRKKQRVKQDTILSRAEYIKTEIGGVLGTEQSSMFNSTVWNKIYDAAMLKEAVKNITVPLFYAEDVYLNFWAFINPNTESVSARTKGVYVWASGIGFSSDSDSAEALFRDYELIKPTMLPLLEEAGVERRVIWNNHVETLYFALVYTRSISKNNSKNEVIKKITHLFQYQHIQNAKKFICENQDLKPWEELLFMAENQDAEEYFQHFIHE